jgi:phosphomannomutase
MIPWLLVAELLCLKNSSLKALVADRQAAFPASGEINRKLENAAAAIARIRNAMNRMPPTSTPRTVSVLNTLSGALTCAAPIPSRWCV